MSKTLLVYCFILFDVFLILGMYFLGMDAIIAKDTSYISHIITGLYLFANVLMLYILYNPATEYIRRLLNWIPSAMVSLGLLGTILGMFVVFNDLFVDLNFDDFENVKSILGQMVNGFSVAALTTIAGIGASLLTTFKFVWFKNKELIDEGEKSDEGN